MPEICDTSDVADIEELLLGKIGYTTDGFVFFITDARDPDRQHIQATFTWDPETAMKMAQDIINADVTEGLIIYRLETVDRNKETIQVKFTWNPKTAIEIAQHIANAAGDAAKLYNAAIKKKKGKKK